MIKITNLIPKKTEEKTEEKFEEKFQKFHDKYLKNVQDTPEYQLNEMQISCIKNVLINRADVPEKIVCWLIEAVKNNTILEYSTTSEKIFQDLKRSQVT